MRHAFVKRLLEKLIEDAVISRDQAVLCVCAGEAEREVFSDLRFTDVTISNLDERMTAESFQPFDWSHQDAHAGHGGDQAITAMAMA